MAEVLKTTFLLRRGYESAWERNNPVLACGEPGFVIDKNALKIGDGITAWKDLEYVNDKNGGIFNADSHLNFPATGSPNIIYKAELEKIIYQWNSPTQVYETLNEISIEDSVPPASSDLPGILKVYDSIGSNVDGAMTQKAITDELNTKVELTLKEDEELVVFSF